MIFPFEKILFSPLSKKPPTLRTGGKLVENGNKKLLKIAVWVPVLEWATVNEKWK